MPIPQERVGVPREEVYKVVQTMLENPDVGDVHCEEQEDLTYWVQPLPKIPRSK